MLSERTYKAMVVEHGFSKSKKGSDQFFAKFLVSDEAKGISEEMVGYFSLSDKAVKYTLEKIRAMGYNGGNLGELADGNILSGNVCQVTIVHKEYEGTVRAKINFVNPEGFVPGAQRDAAAAKNAERFNSMLKAIPPAVKAVKAAPDPRGGASGFEGRTPRADDNDTIGPDGLPF